MKSPLSTWRTGRGSCCSRRRSSAQLSPPGVLVGWKICTKPAILTTTTCMCWSSSSVSGGEYIGQHNTGGGDWSSGINVSSDLVNIHVRSVLGIRADSMIVLDESIEDPGEVLVAMAISSVDTAVLIVEYKSICNSLDEGEPAISCRLWHSIRGSRSRCTIQTRQNSALDKTGFLKFLIDQLYISFLKYSREFLINVKS